MANKTRGNLAATPFQQSVNPIPVAGSDLGDLDRPGLSLVYSIRDELAWHHRRLLRIGGVFGASFMASMVFAHSVPGLAAVTFAISIVSGLLLPSSLDRIMDLNAKLEM